MKLKTKAKLLLATSCISASINFCNTPYSLDFHTVKRGLKHSQRWTKEKIKEFFQKPACFADKEGLYCFVVSVLYHHTIETRNGSHVPKDTLSPEDQTALIELCKLFEKFLPDQLNTDIIAGRTLLHYATAFDCPFLADILLHPQNFRISAPPANINAKTTFRLSTPLISAQMFYSPNMVAYLTGQGADANTRDRLQKTATDHSVAQRHYPQAYTADPAKQVRYRRQHLFTQLHEKWDIWARQLNISHKANPGKFRPSLFVDVEREIEAFLNNFEEINADIGGVSVTHSCTQSTLLHHISQLLRGPIDVPTDTRRELALMFVRHLAEHGLDPKTPNAYRHTFGDMLRMNNRSGIKKFAQKILKQFDSYSPNPQKMLEELATTELPHSRSDLNNLKTEMLTFIRRYASSHQTENGIDYQDEHGDTILHTLIRQYVLGKLSEEHLLLFCNCLNEFGINTLLENNDGKTALQMLEEASNITYEAKQEVRNIFSAEVPHAHELNMPTLTEAIENLTPYVNDSIDNIQKKLKECKIIDRNNRITHAATGLATLREAIRILDNDGKRKILTPFFICLQEAGLPATTINHCNMSDKAMLEFLNCLSETYRETYRETYKIGKLMRFIERLPEDTRMGDINVILQYCGIFNERNRIIHDRYDKVRFNALHEAICFLNNNNETDKLTRLFRCLQEGDLTIEDDSNLRLPDNKAISLWMQCLSESKNAFSYPLACAAAAAADPTEGSPVPTAPVADTPTNELDDTDFCSDSPLILAATAAEPTEGFPVLKATVADTPIDELDDMDFCLGSPSILAAAAANPTRKSSHYLNWSNNAMSDNKDLPQHGDLKRSSSNRCSGTGIAPTKKRARTEGEDSDLELIQEEEKENADLENTIKELLRPELKYMSPSCSSYAMNRTKTDPTTLTGNDEVETLLRKFGTKDDANKLLYAATRVLSTTDPSNPHDPKCIILELIVRNLLRRNLVTVQEVNECLAEATGALQERIKGIIAYKS